MESISQYFEKIEREYIGRIAFRYFDLKSGEKIQISYDRFINDVRCFAGYLRQKENFEGTHVGILALSSYENIVCMFGVLLAGGKVVQLNVQESWEKLNEEIHIADVSILYVDETITQRFPELSDLDINIPIFSLEEIFQEQGTPFRGINRTIDPEEYQILIFTSGTTSGSKAVMISNKNIAAMFRYNERQIHRVMETFEMKTFSCYMLVPMYHVSGLNMALLFPWLGETVNICCSIKNIYHDLLELKPEYMMVPPILVTEFYKEMKKEKGYKLSSVKTIMCGGAALDADYIESFAENGIFLCIGYGLTETTGIGSLTSLEDWKIKKTDGSSGVSEEECQISIIDGEVCMKGDTVSQGYYHNPEATREAFDENGFFHSGDMGTLDEEGRLFLTGRKKNLIILSSGENVLPEELERILYKNEMIIECLVKEKEKKICAEIFCDISNQDMIKEYIRNENKILPMYKRITMVEFREIPFEHTSIGKIKRS